MPGSVPKELEEQRLTFVRDDPLYGPERTEAERTSVGLSVGHTDIYNIFKNCVCYLRMVQFIIDDVFER